VTDLPRPVEELVCQLLEKDPAKRLPDALVVMKRLEQIKLRLEMMEQHLESETVERPGPGTTIRSENESAEWDVHHPGPATMVRNMIRDDVTSSLVKSPVAKFFDNIFVLITLLALIIVFGIWMNRRSVADPGEQLAKARELLAREPSPVWLRARDEFLQPLLDTNALPNSKEEIDTLILKANQFDFCRSLRADPESSKDEASELQRLIRRTFETFSNGDPVAAREQLQAVRELAAHDSRNEYLSQFLVETQQKWDKEPLTGGRKALLERILIEAEAMAKSGDPASVDRAVKTLTAARQIYSNDRAVTEESGRIDVLLKQLQPKP
jgi:serine/threonine-protein kinase